MMTNIDVVGGVPAVVGSFGVQLEPRMVLLSCSSFISHQAVEKKKSRRERRGRGEVEARERRSRGEGEARERRGFFITFH